MNKKVALVLGGTVPHVELIKKLKGRGYYTILVDYLSDSPAKNVANEHIQESTLDQEKVLEIAREKKAELVISSCVDQANITACYVMEKIGKIPPYSYDLAKKITNKGYMKKIMHESKIPTSQYIYVEAIEDGINEKVEFPVMVKPADSNSANGVKKVNNQEELKSYLDDALEISRNHKAIVEGYVEGREISAYCFVCNNEARLLMTAERLSVIDGPDKVIKCYASVAPAKITEKQEKRAEEIATKIAQAFGLNNTPLFFQGIVRDDDIYVIEFAPRVGGGISFKTIKDNTGVDVIDASIDSYLGREVSIQMEKAKHILVVNTIYGKDGIFDHITGQEEAMKEGYIESIYLHKKPGAVLDNSRASSSRVGAFITKADSFEEANEKIRKAYDLLDVLNSEGKSIIRKEMSIPKQIKF